MKDWRSTRYSWPGDKYIFDCLLNEIYFIVVYHHGDNAIMHNFATWNGNSFVIGTTCYCDECDCDCSYRQDYSKGCFVTHWHLFEEPVFDMDIYEQ